MDSKELATSHKCLLSFGSIEPKEQYSKLDVEANTINRGV